MRLRLRLSDYITYSKGLKQQRPLLVQVNQALLRLIKTENARYASCYYGHPHSTTCPKISDTPTDKLV